MKIAVEMPWRKNLSVNHMRFGPGGHYRKKPEVQEWMAVLTWGTKAQQWMKDIPTDKVAIVVDFYYPDARRRDDHNFYKVICDAVAAGLGIDDKDIRISTGEIVVDREEPGFTITITDMIE